MIWDLIESVSEGFLIFSFVIGSSHGLWWIDLKICAHVTDIFKVNVKTFENGKVFTGFGSLIFTSDG